MSTFDGLYSIRAATQDDKNFVLKSFLLGLYYDNTWFSRIPKRLFMNNYKVVANKLFDDPANLVVVACLQEDPTVILGYSILSADGTVVHWVYVKKAWRSRGIMRRLVPSSISCATHLTELGNNLINKYKPEVIFNPFLI